MAKENDKWYQRIVPFTTLWVARLVLATLAFAGTMSLLDSVDKVIAYPFATVFVGFLIKETL